MQPSKKTIIYDFDSTIVQCETLDLLAKIIYANSPQLDEIANKIAASTKACMEGTVSIHESLVSRVEFLNISKPAIAKAIDILQQNITPSFLNNLDFIQQHRQDTFIFSGGFKEMILPIAKMLDIPSENVFANTFIFKDDKVVSIDSDCPLAYNAGKAKQLLQLNRQGDVFVIGDGMTDAEITQVGPQVKFYLFSENVLRENLSHYAEKTINNLDEFIEAEFSACN